MEKREKTGGRKKNSPNKTTTEIKNLFIQVLGANMDTIQKDLDEMPGKDRLAALLKISSMVIPKPIEPVNIDGWQYVKAKCWVGVGGQCRRAGELEV